MGNSGSGAAAENFRQQYQEVKTEYNQHLGEITIFKKNSNPNIMVMSKEKVFQNPEQIAFFQHELSKRQRLNTDNIASLLNVLSKLSQQKNLFERKKSKKVNFYFTSR